MLLGQDTKDTIMRPLCSSKMQDIERVRLLYEFNAVLYFRRQFDEDYAKLKNRFINKKEQAIEPWMENTIKAFQDKFKGRLIKITKFLGHQLTKNLDFRYAWLHYGKQLPFEPWEPQGWSFFKWRYNADQYYIKHPKRRKKVKQEELEEYLKQGYHETEHEVRKF